MHTNTPQNLTASLTRVNFYDADSGFTIANAVETPDNAFTIVGYFNGGIPGEIITAQGHWRRTRQNETQFYVEKFTKSLPQTPSAMRQYLNAGHIAGLSQSLIEALIKRFGPELFELFTHNSAKLNEIARLTPNKIRQITSSWQKHLVESQLADFLQQVAVAPSFAAPIYREFGVSAINQIKANPFILAPVIQGLSFITLSFMARKFNINYTAANCVKYGLLALLGDARQKGHAYYPYAKLLANAVKKLGVTPGIIANAVAVAAAENLLVIKDLNRDDKVFVLNNKAVYLKQVYDNEYALAKSIKRHLATPVSAKLKNAASSTILGTAIKPLLTKLKTGKCCLVDTRGVRFGWEWIPALQKLERSSGLNIILASAALPNLSNADPTMLPYMEEIINGAIKNGDILNCDILALNRAEKLTAGKLNQIMRILPPQAALVLTGDSILAAAQGYGSIFNSLAGTKIMPVLNLNDINPPGEPNPLNQATHNLSKGRSPQMTDFKSFDPAQSGLYFIEQDNPVKIMHTIGGVCANWAPKALGLNPLNIQVMCLTPKGPLGAKRLNIFLQNRLNPNAAVLKYNGLVYKINDKIIQTRDNPAKHLGAGQTGLVTNIDLHKQEISVAFAGLSVKYAMDELNQIKPAWAITVNETGGYLRKTVVLPLHCEAYINLNLTSLYIAFASAAQTIIVVGQKRALETAVKNNENRKIYTGLKELLQT